MKREKDIILAKCPECEKAFYIRKDWIKNIRCPYCEERVNLIIK